MKTYWQKLKDPRWQRKRLEVLNENDFTCMNCGDNESELHVHHPAYVKGREPWEYDIDELQTLCNPCHKSAHYEIDLVTDALNNIKLNTNSSHTSNMELAGLLTAFAHDGPFDIYIHDGEFAMGVGAIYGKSYDDVIANLNDKDSLPHEVISKWITELRKGGSNA